MKEHPAGKSPCYAGKSELESTTWEQSWSHILGWGGGDRCSPPKPKQQGWHLNGKKRVTRAGTVCCVSRCWVFSGMPYKVMSQAPDPGALFWNPREAKCTSEEVPWGPPEATLTIHLGAANGWFMHSGQWCSHIRQPPCGIQEGTIVCPFLKFCTTSVHASLPSGQKWVVTNPRASRRKKRSSAQKMLLSSTIYSGRSAANGLPYLKPDISLYGQVGTAPAPGRNPEQNVQRSLCLLDIRILSHSWDQGSSILILVLNLIFLYRIIKSS